VILLAGGFAEIIGCRPDQKSTCVLGGLAVSDIIAFALQAGPSLIVNAVRTWSVWLAIFYVAIAGWLVLCYIAVIRGWTGTLSRLLLGFIVALIFAFLPYFGAMLAIARFVNDNCRPNEGGIGACAMFGGYVGRPEDSPAHDAVIVGWLALFGAPIVLALFAVYAATLIGIVVSKKRGVASRQ
jgi:hypothetical protein